MISNIVSFLVSCLVTKIFAHHIKNPYYRLFITEEVAHALCQIIKNDKIVDEIEDYLLFLVMWEWGEPFLNPELPDMLRYASDKGIKTVTSTKDTDGSWRVAGYFIR